MWDKRVLVTGSSRGIGRAVAQRLAKEGWKVAVHGATNSSSLREAAELLGGQAAGVYSQNLSGADGAKALWSKAIADGPIHALVNNAGVYRPHSFCGLTDAQFTATISSLFATNWEAPLWLTRLACQEFLKQGGGRVVQVASRVGHRGEAGAAGYAASKSAILNLVRSLAVEHASDNIRHFAIAPGWVDTAMAREGMTDRLESILATIPLGRMATPEDCANAVNWLLSGEADYMSGLVIDINGASYLR